MPSTVRRLVTCYLLPGTILGHGPGVQEVGECGRVQVPGQGFCRRLDPLLKGGAPLQEVAGAPHPNSAGGVAACDNMKRLPLHPVLQLAYAPGSTAGLALKWLKTLTRLAGEQCSTLCL